MARSYKRDSKGRFSGSGGGGKASGAKAEYKAASRATRVAAREAASANARGVSKNSRVRAGERLATARTNQLKTELKLSGKSKQLSALNKAEKKSAAIKSQMAAKRAVSSAHARAGKTVKGKVAAVKRFLSGGKKKRA